MSLSISIDTGAIKEQFILYSHRPNESGQLDLFFRGRRLIYEGTRHSEIYRGTLYDALTPEAEGCDVVCKVAYGESTTQLLKNEITFYEGKLQHLQGVYIPVCHGYFMGQTSEGPTICLVLDYCGEPVKDAFPDLSPTFKTAILHAALAIHDAGVATYDWAERNVLDYRGLPMIIDFDEAALHKCERTMQVVEGKPAPPCVKFGCGEIFQLVKDLRLWKPNVIRFLGVYYPLAVAVDPHNLATKAPKGVPPKQAYREAVKAIREHGKMYYPAEVKAWKAAAAAKEIFFSLIIDHVNIESVAARRSLIPLSDADLAIDFSRQPQVLANIVSPSLYCLSLDTRDSVHAPSLTIFDLHPNALQWRHCRRQRHSSDESDGERSMSTPRPLSPNRSPTMSISVSLSTEETTESFILYSHRPNDAGQADLVFHGTELIYEGTRRSEIYRGRLFNSSSSDSKGRDVVCKMAYGKRTIDLLKNEIKIYEGRLRHLQGVYIPVCHGYFLGESQEGRTSCLILDYCGEPIKKAFPDLEGTFKTAILHAALAIHDAGVLTYGAKRSGLQGPTDHFEGSTAPKCAAFGCGEIYQLVEDLRLWKPSLIRFLGVYYPLDLAVDPRKLAAKAPRYMSRKKAYQAAVDAIIEHGELYYPDETKVWKAAAAAAPAKQKEKQTSTAALPEAEAKACVSRNS
ncbi:hypothetical protein EVG20_g4975 [Dentipellis fragilis]|uniref:Protein kinase domain-containing protein n=1 Tax=Dentipellis fragilis TaxID=205917 RepID=A0A4Y9YWI1_9AGAM|nr:hypothetical protein EVG20_g4975 [Dentipellis fragilis]